MVSARRWSCTNGSRLGAPASQALYLAAGVAGLPVFAASATLPPGAWRLLGPTAGYLLSYPLAAFVARQRWPRRGFDRRYLTSICAMALGSPPAIYTCGTPLWLAYGTFGRTAIGLSGAVAAGVAPFVVADVVKLAAAAGIVPGLWRLVGIRSREPLAALKRVPVTALTIAGSDSGGGAGIQADLKTFAAHGVYGMSAITAVTAQNTLGVSMVERVSSDHGTAQIEAVVADIGVHAAKTGMLANAAIVEAVARVMRGPTCPARGRSGDGRQERRPADRRRRRRGVQTSCCRWPFVVTPNIPEAEALAGIAVRTPEDVREAARRMPPPACSAVIVKGGHAGPARHRRPALPRRDVHRVPSRTSAGHQHPRHRVHLRRRARRAPCARPGHFRRRFPSRSATSPPPFARALNSGRDTGP